MATPLPYNFVGPLAPGQTRAPAPPALTALPSGQYNGAAVKTMFQTPDVHGTPAAPSTPNPYNFANLVKPFASLATPFSALAGKPATPNLPTPLTPKPITPTITPAPVGKVAGASTSIPSNLPSGFYYGPQAVDPMANPQDHGTPAAPVVPPPAPAVTFPASVPTPSGLMADPATGSVSGPATTVQGGATPPPMDSPATGIPGVGAGNTGYNSPEYKKALQDYEDSLKMSPEEEANQKAQDDLESSLAIGKANTSNQPIPMEFITGQLKAKEDRASALDVPLQKKAALLQAKRTAAVDANKFALDEMDKKIQADTDAHKPISVAPGTTLVDPATGKTIYSAAAKPDTSVVDVNGHKVLIDNNTGNTIKDLGSSGSGTTAADDALVGSQIHSVNGTDAKGNAFTQPFINLSDFPDAASKKTAMAYGAANGIPVLNPAEGEKMVSIDNAYTNIDKIAGGMKGLVANTPGLNLTEGLWNSITGKLGNAGVASFNAWRTAVINNVQALAGGSGSGLRINQAEIDTALKNDLPNIQGLGADTMASAQAKLDRLKDQLDSWRLTILDKGNANVGNTGGGQIIEYNGKQYQTDKDGNFDPNSPLSKGGGGTPTATGMRTDRNNNPTAMTTAVAKSLGLVEGVDYQNTKDTFGGGQFATAKLLGNPVQTTIKGLDLAASRSAADKAKSGGAFATASGGKRWSYATPTDQQWLAMTPAQKVAAVQKMYHQEGGTQLASAFNTTG